MKRKFTVFSVSVCHDEGEPDCTGSCVTLTVFDNGSCVLSGRAYRDATSSEMELRSAINAFDQVLAPASVHLELASQLVLKSMKEGYVKKWMKNGWKTTHGGEVANKALWKELHAHFSNPALDIRFTTDVLPEGTRMIRNIATQLAGDLRSDRMMETKRLEWRGLLVRLLAMEADHPVHTLVSLLSRQQVAV